MAPNEPLDDAAAFMDATRRLGHRRPRGDVARPDETPALAWVFYAVGSVELLAAPLALMMAFAARPAADGAWLAASAAAFTSGLLWLGFGRTICLLHRIWLK
jgi:hypothetical protein